MVTTKKHICHFLYCLWQTYIWSSNILSSPTRQHLLCIIESYRFHGAGHFLPVSLHSIGRCMLSEYQIAFLTSWCPCHYTISEIPSKYLWCVCARAKSLQFCPTLCDSVDYSLLASSGHGILQARILGWVAMLSFRIFLTQGSNLHSLWLLHCGWILHYWASGEVQILVVPLIYSFLFVKRGWHESNIEDYL